MGQSGPPPAPEPLTFELDDDGPKKPLGQVASVRPPADPQPAPTAAAESAAADAIPRVEKPIHIPVVEPPTTISAGKVVGALAAVVALIVLVVMVVKGLTPDKVPPLVLPTNHEGDLPVNEVLGARTGVILYLAVMPNGQHGAILDREVATVEAMDESERYDVRLVFGADELTVAQGALDGVEATVFMDPGKKLGNELGLEYAGIVFFDKDGKILKSHKDAFLTTDVEGDEQLDTLLKE